MTKLENSTHLTPEKRLQLAENTIEGATKELTAGQGHAALKTLLEFREQVKKASEMDLFADKAFKHYSSFAVQESKR